MSDPSLILAGVHASIKGLHGLACSVGDREITEVTGWQLASLVAPIENQVNEVLRILGEADAGADKSSIPG